MSDLDIGFISQGKEGTGCYSAVATKADSAQTFGEHMAIGKTTKNAPESRPFRVADHLRNEREIAGYLEAVLEEGEPRMLPRALRTVAEALGGVGKLAERTGLSRETLYRTLSERGNPRYDTLFNILTAFGLRVSVVPTRRTARSQRRAA